MSLFGSQELAELDELLANSGFINFNLRYDPGELRWYGYAYSGVQGSVALDSVAPTLEALFCGLVKALKNELPNLTKVWSDTGRILALFEPTPEGDIWCAAFHRLTPGSRIERPA